MAVCDQTTIRINRDRDFQQVFSFTNCDGSERDLTDYEFFLQARKTINEPDPPLLSLTSNPAAGIVILPPPTKGVIEITITKAQSSALPSGVFPFDLFLITDEGKEETAISGFMSVYDSTGI